MPAEGRRHLKTPSFNAMRPSQAGMEATVPVAGRGTAGPVGEDAVRSPLPRAQSLLHPPAVHSSLLRIRVPQYCTIVADDISFLQWSLSVPVTYTAEIDRYSLKPVYRRPV